MDGLDKELALSALDRIVPGGEGSIERLREKKVLLDEMLSIQGVLKVLPTVTSFSRLTSIVERKEIAGLVPLEDVREMIETKLQERYEYLNKYI